MIEISRENHKNISEASFWTDKNGSIRLKLDWYGPDTGNAKLWVDPEFLVGIFIGVGWPYLPIGRSFAKHEMFTIDQLRKEPRRVAPRHAAHTFFRFSLDFFLYFRSSTFSQKYKRTLILEK